MTTLVTRPEPQASTWADALMAQGVTARALPLIAIDAPPHTDAVTRLWQQLAQQRVLMFVSPAAVEWFFRLRPASPAPSWPTHTLAAAPGPGTASALLTWGAQSGLQPEHIVSPDRDAEQFDSEALWPLLAQMRWQDQRVTIVSGGNALGASGRAWLSEQWRNAGAEVKTVQAYRRGPGDWAPAAQALACQALAAPAAHVWLLSSSEAVDHLVQHHLPSLASADASFATPNWPQMRALCTHPRIAEHAQARGFGDVRLCSPTVEAVVQARRSHP